MTAPTAPATAPARAAAATHTGASARRVAAIAALVIGIGLALAPAAFQMFTRAPGGGEMLDGFRPFMDAETVGSFQGHMATIGAAAGEAPDDPSLSAVNAFTKAWPTIDADMGDMLTTMADSLDNFAAVDALPPFALFPFFFVLPGLFLAAAAVWHLRTGRVAAVGAMAAVAVGLIAAPFVFQMFTRAPLGGEMIDDFKPLMTREKVQTIQGYFLVLGAGEGELRTRVLPAADSGSLPAVERLTAEWPTISNEMAPMIGAMSDNVTNFEGVAAMPPFPLFPWFFVLPGVIVLVLLAAPAVRARAAGRTGVATGDAGGVSVRVALPVMAVVLAVVLAACGGGDSSDDAAGSRGQAGLAGLWSVDAGTCTDGGVEQGSWFRMVQSGGSAESGPFVPNGDSTCGDKTWTPLAPGTDGGLKTGDYQPQPDPPFDADGGSQAASIVAPVKFFAVAFGLATNPTDPQTGEEVPNPTIVEQNGVLSGQLTALAASWNGQHFNQGTPKPGADGDKGNLSGTYDPSTGRYTLDWTSLIVGGPFDGFTGVWHFEGTFTAR